MVLAGSEGALQQEELEAALRSVGGQGEALARVRLGLLTVERMLGVLMLRITDKEAAGRWAGRGGAWAGVRLGLLTVERMLGVLMLWITDKEAAGRLKGFIKSLTRDI